MDPESRIRDFIVDDLAWQVSRDELTGDFSLVESGMLDSMDLLKLVAMIEEEYGLRFRDEDLVPENFETIGGIARLIEARRAS